MVKITPEMMTELKNEICEIGERFDVSPSEMIGMMEAVKHYLIANSFQWEWVGDNGDDNPTTD